MKTIRTVLLSLCALVALLGLAWRWSSSLPLEQRAVKLEIRTLVASSVQVLSGEKVRLSCQLEAGAERVGDLEYLWTASAGALLAEEACNATWQAPSVPGNYYIDLMVKQGDADATRSIGVSVRLPSPRQMRADHYGVDSRFAPTTTERTREARSAAEKRVQELRAEMEKPFNPNDIYAIGRAREALGRFLIGEGRYEEAFLHYHRLLGDEGLGSPVDLKYRRELGTAAFYLGREDEALQAFLDAAEANTSQTSYYLGLLLEKRGRMDEALQAYRVARTGPNKWFAEPVLRGALILLESGEPDAALGWLIDQSPALGREAILKRLEGDPEFSPLYAALAKSGRAGEFVEQRGLTEADMAKIDFWRNPGGSKP